VTSVGSKAELWGYATWRLPRPTRQRIMASKRGHACEESMC
jgi:hypothetical protein